MHHFGHGAQDVPADTVDVAQQADLRRGHARVFGVAAVESAAHAADDGGDGVVGVEFASWCRGDETDGFDAEDPWEGDAGGGALAGEHFGAVQAEGFDADQDPAVGGGGDGAVLEGEDAGSAGLVDDGCAHCFGGGGGHGGWGMG